MPNIMDAYNSGLQAASNKIRNRYLDPMLADELYESRTQSKYLDPTLAAQLYALKIRNRYLDPMLADELYKSRTQSKYLDPTLAAQLYARQTENKFLPEKLRLANEYHGLANKYYAPEHEANIREMNFFADNPLLKMPGAAGQVGSMLYLKNQGNQGSGGLASPMEMQQSSPNMPNDMQSGSAPSNRQQEYNNGADAILGNLNTLSRTRNSIADLNVERKKNYNWGQLPAETRSNLIAQGLGMGIDPIKMKNYVNDGMAIKEIASKEGRDPNNIPPPVYYPTSTTKTRVQQVQQVGAELVYLESATTAIIKRYADTFAGISPQRIKDMLSNDPDAQKRFGQYIGAMSVQTGVANGRVLLEGGKSGLEIMREVKNSALAGVDKHAQFKMSGIAFEETQKTIGRMLQRGAKIRTMKGMNPFGKNDDTNTEDPLGMNPFGKNDDTNTEDPLGLLK